MAINLPVPGEQTWGNKLNAAFQALEARDVASATQDAFGNITFTREDGSVLTVPADSLDEIDALTVASFQSGEWSAEGAKVTPRVALRSSTTGALLGTEIEIAPAHTQLLVNSAFTGATLGVVNAGGTGGGVAPTGWTSFPSAVDKTIIRSGGGEILWSSPVSSSGSGWRSTNYFAATSDIVVSFDVSVTGLPLDKEVHLVIGMHNQTGGVVENQVGTTYGTSPHTSREPEQPRRITAIIPNPGGSRALVIYFETPAGQSNTGLTATFTISNVLVSYASEVGTDPVRQPAYHTTTGARTEREVVLDVPNGPYHVLARSEDGVVRGGSVTVAGNTGLSLRAALGAGRFSDIWTLKPGTYSGASVELLGGPQYTSAVHSKTSDSTLVFSSGMAAMALNRSFKTGLAITAEGRSPSHSVQVATNFPGLSRFEVRNGEVSPGDGSTQERAELADWEQFPYATSFVTAGWFTVDEMQTSSSSFSPRPIVVRQLRYVLDPDPGVNPEFTMNMYPRTIPGRWGLQFRTVFDGASPATAAGAGLQVLPQSGENIWEFDMGKWVYVVTRTRFAQGTGRAEVWINSTGLPGTEQKIIDYTGNVGYQGVSNFRFRSGLYSSTWPSTRICRHYDQRFGPATSLNAEALAAFPSPLIVQ